MLIMIDLDNTLGDRAGAVDAWIATFVARHQLDTVDADWIRTLDNDGYSTRLEVLTAIKERFGLPTPIGLLLSSYQSDVIELTNPVPGAAECLTQLRAAGWTIAIVTNGSTRQQNAKIDRLGFRSMVDAVVVSETLGIKKPDSAIFEHAAALCQVDLSQAPSASWMVGDSPLHDITGASALGLSTAWLPRGRTWPEDQQQPTVVVHDLTALPAQLVALA